MHVSAPVAIWTYAYAYVRAGGDANAIWSYVYACFSACGHMDLRFYMLERRRRHGVTFLHIAAPAVIWTYVYAYGGFAGGGARANVAVARVSCIWRVCGGMGGVLPFSAGLGFGAHLAQREL